MKGYGKKRTGVSDSSTDTCAARRAGSSFSDSQSTTPPRVVNRQSSRDGHAQNNRGMPTAKDRPNLRDNAVYLGDHCVGMIRGDAFVRSFDSAANSLAWGRALSYRSDLLELVRQRGVKALKARDRATGDAYIISLDRFLTIAEPLSIKGFGPQVAGDLRHWERKLPPGGPVQLGLFSGRPA